jgi:hypothetical protein
MGFDVATFLGKLFGGPIVTTAAVAPEPVPQPEAADAGQPAPVPSGGPGAGPEPDPFPGWVRRQDVFGRWGWEAPDLPEAARWWARSGFEALPEAGTLDKGLQLARLAAELRAKAKTGPPGLRPVRFRRPVDTQDLGGNRPAQGQLRGFGGA